MQITIDIPDELSHLIQNKGKSLDVAIIEALGLYSTLHLNKLHHWQARCLPYKGFMINICITSDRKLLYVQHDTPTNPTQTEIDWAAKWEQWFTECETMPRVRVNR